MHMIFVSRIVDLKVKLIPKKSLVSGQFFNRKSLFLDLEVKLR